MKYLVHTVALSFAMSLTSCVKYETHDSNKGSAPPSLVVQKSSELKTHTQIFLIDSPLAKAQLGKALHAGFEACETSPTLFWQDANEQKHLRPQKSKTPKNEFSLKEVNPNPFALIESLNLFSEDILPQKIDGASQIGAIPYMLLNYAQFMERESNRKISYVVSSKKIAGSLIDTAPQSADQVCENHLIKSITFGAALSASLGLIFRNEADRNLFVDTFGETEIFLGSKTLTQEETMTKFLIDKSVEINFSVAQLGGDVEKTKKFVSEMSCSVQNLDACRLAQKQIFAQFYAQEQPSPLTRLNSNGWTPVQISTHAIPNLN